MDLHLTIDGQAHRERRDRPEVKNRLLEQYKASMMAKRIKRAAEKMQEVEMERRIMEEGGGMQEIGAQSRS